MSPAHSRSSDTPGECPVCGADVPPGARACPECGADERTGWNDEMTAYDGIDLPDSAFEDDSFPAKQASSPAPRLGRIALHWWLTAFALLAIFAAAALYRLF